jgi:hypothetical protein
MIIFDENFSVFLPHPPSFSSSSLDPLSGLGSSLYIFLNITWCHQNGHTGLGSPLIAIWPLNSLIPLEEEENRAISPVVIAGVIFLNIRGTTRISTGCFVWASYPYQVIQSAYFPPA